jgi:hypothetical protein
MKNILYEDAKKLKENWHRLRPQEIPDCFEQYDEEGLIHFRVVGFNSIGIEGELKDFLQTNYNNKENVAISLHMGVNAGVIQPFLELAVLPDSRIEAPAGGRLPYKSSTLVRFNDSLNDFSGILKNNDSQMHKGVSFSYQQDCVLAWDKLEYEKMSRVFFQPSREIEGNKNFESVFRPIRVSRFFFPDADKEILFEGIHNKDGQALSLFVYFGLNYNHWYRNQISFTPIFMLEKSAESEASASQSLIDGGSESTDVTYFDFLHPCPPFCGDPPGTGQN